MNVKSKLISSLKMTRERWFQLEELHTKDLLILRLVNRLII